MTNREDELILQLKPVEWDGAVFGTGITTIDDQHRVLFGIYNLLVDKVRAHDLNLMDAVNLAVELEEFVIVHFKYEEDCMHHYGCAREQENIDGHRMFRKTLDELIMLLKNTIPSFTDIAPKLIFLRDWFETHIKGIDSCLCGCKERFEKKLEESRRLER